MVVKTAYKVRLEDGMEVGPLDGEMIRSWYQQGMVNPDTKIRAQGSKRWVRLADTFEVGGWGEPHAASAQAEEELEALEAEARQTWRTYFACALFFLLAAASAYFALFPSLWRIPPGAPWREIALGFVVLGLLLVRGWEPMRKLVRALVLLLTLALFPLAEVLIFRGVPWRSLVVLIPAVAMGFGLFFFLSGRYKPWPRVALNLFWVLAGAAGVVLAGAFPPPALAAWMEAPSPLPDALRPAMLNPPPQPTAPAIAAPLALPEPAMGMPSTIAPSPSAAPLGAPSAAAVIQEVPLLSPRAADVVRARAVFAPEDAFRRSYELAGNGVAALDGRERGELGELMAAAYGNIPAADRRRLEAYMAGIRGGQISTSEQNREMSALMRTAVLKLSDSQRSRLQAVYEKAILAAR
jgi:hypothetical protein